MLQCCEATPPHVPEDVFSASQATASQGSAYRPGHRMRGNGWMNEDGWKGGMKRRGTGKCKSPQFNGNNFLKIQKTCSDTIVQV